MNKITKAIIFLSVLAMLGCAEFHTDPEAVPEFPEGADLEGSTLIHTLDEAQWEEVCTWGESYFVYLNGADSVSCPSGATNDFPASECMNNHVGHISPECETTLGQFTNVVTAISSDPCGETSAARDAVAALPYCPRLP